MLSKAGKRLHKSQMKSVQYWDKNFAHWLQDPLQKGDLVLLYNRSLELQWGKPFSKHWNQ